MRLRRNLEGDLDGDLEGDLERDLDGDLLVGLTPHYYLQFDLISPVVCSLIYPTLFFLFIFVLVCLFYYGNFEKKANK